MTKRIAVIGAGVSGLTCAVVLAERGAAVTILAEETGERTTSAAAAAIWYPYDAEPADSVERWALITYARLSKLAADVRAGVAMTELRYFKRVGEMLVPPWARSLGARSLTAGELIDAFTGGFALTVPVLDTSVYLRYLAERFRAAGGSIEHAHLGNLDLAEFDLVVHCAGIGARDLASDPDVEPHRGQVAIVGKPSALHYAIVCDDPPLMYVIPRTRDCVFGGTNEMSADRSPSLTDTRNIVAECSRVLRLSPPEVRAVKVGLRPYRRTGIRVEIQTLPNNRHVIHNYGHGGCGFTVSWGCAEEVLALSESSWAH